MGVVKTKNELKTSMSTIYKEALEGYIEKKEMGKWEKAAELAKKDKNYLRFINEINNESTVIKETIDLLSSKTNRDRLDEAIEQIENLKFTKRELTIKL